MRIEHRGAKIFALVLFALVCVLTFLYLFTSAGGKLRLSSPYTAKTVVPTAFQLVQNGDVRLAGVKVGVVQDIESQGENGLVTFELEEEHVPLYKDATVLVRTKTLVGENYLDITRGSPRAGELEDGGTLPLEQAGEAVQLDEVLDSLDEETRVEVRRNLDGLAPGLDGRGEDFNRVFAAMRPTVEDGGVVAGILRRQKTQLASVLDDTATVMSAFAERTEQVRTLARQAKRTAEVVADRDEQFGEAIEELDPTLRQAQFSVGKLGSFSGRATPVMTDLKVAANDLEPLMRDLRPAAFLARKLFQDIPPLTRNLDPLLGELRDFAPAFEKAIGPLDSFLRETNPALEFFAPFEREFGSFFANAGSANEYYDSIGALGRVHAMIGPTSIKGVLTPAEKKALNALLETGGITEFFGTKHNAYPLPDTVQKPDERSAFRRVVPDGE